MNHQRKDSATMTHSSRKSYKDKYLELKDGIVDTNSEANVLAQLAEFQAVAENERARLHSLLQQSAEAVSDLVAMLDSRDGQLGFKVKDVRKPIDSNLPQMDSHLIVRRTRDIVRHATTRLGMAGLGMSELRDSLANITTGVMLLKPTMQRAQTGYLESYVVGRNPTEKEIEAAEENRGTNPRTLAYEYETDESDSESEDEKPAVSSALVPTSPPRVTKPTGRTPAARRIKDASANAIDIS